MSARDRISSVRLLRVSRNLLGLREGNGLHQLLASGSFLVALGIGRKLTGVRKLGFRFLVVHGLAYTFQLAVFLRMSAVMLASKEKSDPSHSKKLISQSSERPVSAELTAPIAHALIFLASVQGHAQADWL